MGRDFALWLGNVFTGNLPRIVIKKKNPTVDDVTATFNDSGLAVTFSSGTSGRHTFIPRDMRTFLPRSMPSPNPSSQWPIPSGILFGMHTC